MSKVSCTDKKARNLATTGIILSWATFWFILFSPFGLLAWIAILIYLIVKKYNIKWYLLLSAWLFVPTIAFLTGTVGYFTGTASLKGVGGPQTFHGIDRDTRVKSTSSGCILVGFEPFVFLANNAAVSLWTKAFGFQKGSYEGVFPTEAEASDYITFADTIIVQHVDNFLMFNVAGQSIKVDTSDFISYRSSSSEFNKVVGKVINNECFVFQRVDIEGTRKLIFIADIKNSELLTAFVDPN